MWTHASADLAWINLGPDLQTFLSVLRISTSLQTDFSPILTSSLKPAMTMMSWSFFIKQAAKLLLQVIMLGT